MAIRPGVMQIVAMGSVLATNFAGAQADGIFDFAYDAADLYGKYRPGGTYKRHEFDVPFSYKCLDSGTYRVMVGGTSIGPAAFTDHAVGINTIQLTSQSVQFVIDPG